MKRFAYLGTSKAGGTYRVFETLRDGLAEHGWLGEFVTGPKTFEPTATWGAGEQEGARILVGGLSRFDLVIANVFVDRRLMNVVQYLPSRLPRVMVVHNITYATYKAARALEPYVHHTVGVSPRVRNDLVRRLGFAEDRTSAIFTGVPDRFFEAPFRAHDDARMRVLSLGRLEQASKNIFLLPEIFREIDVETCEVTIAGDGADRDALMARMSNACIPFEASGKIASAELRHVYQDHDVFVFPSHFEGMGIALAEAMASGLVPVATAIRGVTDMMIDDGVNGFLFPRGSASVARRRITALAADEGLRTDMRKAARRKAGGLFRLPKMIGSYVNLIEHIVSDPEHLPELDLEDWRLARPFMAGVRSILPPDLRQWVARQVMYN